MITAQIVERVAHDVRSSGEARKRVDAYFVVYKCPADSVNPSPKEHEWVCKFEVERGAAFEMSNYPNKQAARSASGYTT